MIPGILTRMLADPQGDPALNAHLTKVWAYTHAIASRELDREEDRETVEIAAIVHDIAIPLCRAKYGSAAGPLQEKEGPALVRAFLASFDLNGERMERIALLVGNHHTIDPILGTDHRILLEADLLVNASEQGYTKEQLLSARERIFRTKTGTALFDAMFGSLTGRINGKDVK